jgi:hypothetical protein
MTFLKSIGMWVLKILLSGIGVKIRTEEQAKAELEREQALAREKAHEQNDKVDDDIAATITEEEAKAKAEQAARPADDPFGNKTWNASVAPKEEPKK